MSIKRLAIIFGLLSLSVGAFADTYTYTFNQYVLNENFSFEVSSLITSDTIIQASDVKSTNIPDLQSVEINPNQPYCGGVPVPGTGNSCAGYLAGQSGLFIFFDDMFNAPGTYTSGPDSLVITHMDSEESPVPEPPTWLLFLTGASGLYLSTRRRNPLNSNPGC
jgi:hypothetical protein